MTIIRDGKEITLTATELAEAFMERLKEHIRDDVEDYIDCECNDVRFKNELMKTSFVDEVVENIYRRYDDQECDFVNQEMIAWQVNDAIDEWELDADDDDGEEEALRKIDEELAERNRPNELKCSNCSFSWYDASVGHDVCHFERLGDWDPAPCEQ